MQTPLRETLTGNAYGKREKRRHPQLVGSRQPRSGPHQTLHGGDQTACAELVAEHQRMVFTLALNLLRDRDEALDLSQEVFLRVFRTLSSFRGQSALRTWIYRIVINQARNRQRWWRRRHRSSQVSLDDHLQQCGELESSGTSSRSGAGQQGNSGEDLARTRPVAVRSADRPRPARD